MGIVPEPGPRPMALFAGGPTGPGPNWTASSQAGGPVFSVSVATRGGGYACETARTSDSSWDRSWLEGPMWNFAGSMGELRTHRPAAPVSVNLVSWTRGQQMLSLAGPDDLAGGLASSGGKAGHVDPGPPRSATCWAAVVMTAPGRKEVSDPRGPDRNLVHSGWRDGRRCRRRGRARVHESAFTGTAGRLRRFGWTALSWRASGETRHGTMNDGGDRRAGDNPCQPR